MGALRFLTMAATLAVLCAGVVSARDANMAICEGFGGFVEGLANAQTGGSPPFGGTWSASTDTGAGAYYIAASGLSDGKCLHFRRTLTSVQGRTATLTGTSPSLPTPYTTFYTSVRVRVSAVGTGAKWTVAVPAPKGSITMGIQGTQFVFGSSTVFGTAAAGQTYHIVVRVRCTGTTGSPGGTEAWDYWVNPANEADTPISTGTNVDAFVNGGGTAALSGTTISIAGTRPAAVAGEAWDAWIDDIRVGTTWASVNPTAPTFGGMASGSVTGASARLASSITSDGGAPMLASGIVVGPTPDPQIGDAGAVALATDPLVDAGLVVVQASGLTPNTPYYYRAYATNSMRTSYSSTATFTTVPLTLSAAHVYRIDRWTQPAVAAAGTGVRVRVYGSGFTADSGGGSASLKLTRPGCTDIVCGNLVWGTGVVTSGWVAMPTDAASLGAWSAVLTTNTGTTTTLSDAVALVDPALTGVTVQADKAWPQARDTLITLTATAQGAAPTSVEYAFQARTYDAASGAYAPSVTLQHYGTADTCDWTPAVAQPYWITVWARDALGTTVRSADLYFRIDEGTLTGAALTVTHNGDGTYTLAASQIGTATNVEYKYVAYVPQDGTGPAFGVPTRYDAFTMLPYTAAASYVWKPSAAVLDKTVKLQVYARVAGATAHLQVVSPMRTVGPL